MTFGTVTGFKIDKNMDGSANVVLLQVTFDTKDDVQTVELIRPHGDVSIPENDTTVYVINLANNYKIGFVVDDNIVPNMQAGEKKFYSTNAGAISAFINLLKNGNIELNGNTDNAVMYAALNTALQSFVSQTATAISALNTALASKLDGGGTAGTAVPGTLNISASKSNKVALS